MKPMKPGEMLTFEQALLRLDEALKDARLPDEPIATLAAGNRILAASTFSVLDLPPFDKAAMDGYGEAREARWEARDGKPGSPPEARAGQGSQGSQTEGGHGEAANGAWEERTAVW